MPDMKEKELISCFDLEKKDYVYSLESALNKLLAQPNTFTALAWQFAYDFLYISPEVSALLGYPLSSFRNNGILFLHSITPPEEIEPLYATLNGQLAAMEKDPDYINRTMVVSAETRIIHRDRSIMNTSFHALPIDYKPGDKNAYLVLGTNFIIEGKTAGEVSRTKETISRLMNQIKQDYIRSNPTRFRYLHALSSVTQRQKEVARLFCQGLSARVVAERLHISPNTVDTHRKNLLSKFEARNTAELVHQLSAFL